MSSEDEKNSERDIGQVLRSAGRRTEPPEELVRSIRAAVEMRWRELVARRSRHRRSGRIGFTLAAGILFVAVAMWAYRPASQPSAEKVADVSVAVGSVRTKDGLLGRWQPARRHETLHAGEVVATAADGRAALALGGAVSLRLDHNTRVAFNSAKSITIESGAVYVDSSEDPQPVEERLSVVTPAGAVRHIGTQYETRLVDAGVRIAVREGRVELNTTAGVTDRAAAGEQLVISAAGAVERSAIAPYDASWRWVSATAPEFNIDGRSLIEFVRWAARELGRNVVFATPESESEASRVRLSGSISGLAPDEALAAVLPTTPLRSEMREGQLLISFNAATR